MNKRKPSLRARARTSHSLTIHSQRLKVWTPPAETLVDPRRFITVFDPRRKLGLLERGPSSVAERLMMNNALRSLVETFKPTYGFDPRPSEGTFCFFESKAILTDIWGWHLLSKDISTMDILRFGVLAQGFGPILPTTPGEWTGDLLEIHLRSITPQTVVRLSIQGEPKDYLLEETGDFVIGIYTRNPPTGNMIQFRIRLQRIFGTPEKRILVQRVERYRLSNIPGGMLETLPPIG